MSDLSFEVDAGESRQYARIAVAGTLTDENAVAFLQRIVEIIHETGAPRFLLDYRKVVHATSMRGKLSYSRKELTRLMRSVKHTPKVVLVRLDDRTHDLRVSILRDRGHAIVITRDPDWAVRHLSDLAVSDGV